MFRAFALLLAATGLALPVQQPARAQGACEECQLPPSCRGTGSGKSKPKFDVNCQVLQITIESDIDFGRVVIIGSGESRVVLDLSTGEKRLVGDVDDLGGMPVTGRAIVTGAPYEPVRVDLPREVDMRDPIGGSAMMRDIVTDLPSNPMLDANGRLEFKFSGTLVIAADTHASGNLRGRVPITVEYP